MLSWQSRAIRRVACSTLAAEVISSTSAFDRASWLRSLHDEVMTSKANAFRTPLDMKTDCQSLVSHVKSMRNQPTEKRLCGDIFAIREAIITGELRSVQHIPTANMLADGLTKNHPNLRQAIIDACKGHVVMPESGERVTMKHLV